MAGHTTRALVATATVLLLTTAPVAVPTSSAEELRGPASTSGAAWTPAARAGTATPSAGPSARAHTPRIVNGRPLQPGEFGFLVAIGLKSRFQQYGLFQAQFCGGTLVTTSLVVTAAHCMYDDQHSLAPAGALVVGAGSDLEAPDAVVDVAAVVAHPAYDFDGTNDVAVLRLGTPLATTPTVAVPSAGTAAALTPAGAAARSAGWGALQYDVNSFPPKALVADLTVFPDTSCGGGQPYTLGGVTFVGIPASLANPAHHICVGGVRDGAIIGDCSGDSGGPLVVGSGDGQRLVGVVSYGIVINDIGCTSGAPDVFTRIGHVADWLASVGVPLDGGTPPAPSPSPTPTAPTPTPVPPTPTPVPPTPTPTPVPPTPVRLLVNATGPTTLRLYVGRRGPSITVRHVAYDPRRVAKTYKLCLLTAGGQRYACRNATVKHGDGWVARAGNNWVWLTAIRPGIVSPAECDDLAYRWPWEFSELRLFDAAGQQVGSKKHGYRLVCRR